MSDADGGLTLVCWSKWPRSFSVLGAKTVFFSVLQQKPRLRSVLRPILPLFFLQKCKRPQIVTLASMMFDAEILLSVLTQSTFN